MQEKIEIEVLERFLSNNCDYVEADKAFAYLTENEDLLDAIEIFHEIPTEALLTTDDVEKDALFVRLKSRLKNTKVIPLRKWAIAASIIGLLAISGYFLMNYGRPVIQKITAITETKITNSTAQQMDYKLPDSSKLTLLPGAALSYKSDFTSKRNINLIVGDAYFKVRKDATHPFSVTANGIKTTALGTEFWVRNFSNTNSVTISLTSGKVSIQSVDSVFSMNAVFLTPGQICTVNKNTGKVDISGLKVPPAPSGKEIPAFKIPSETFLKKNDVTWTNKEMKFTNTKLENVLRKLEQRYDVTILANDPSFSNTYLTGKILYSDSLNTIIRSISQLNNLTYEMHNDTIFLKKK